MNADALEDDALARRIMRLPEPYRWQVIRSLHASEARELLGRWSFWAHHGQAAPDQDWRVWLIRAGRGFGKTRAGAEWISAYARAVPDAKIALVGGSWKEVRQVMIDGPSGLFAVARTGEKLRYWSGSGQLFFPSGAVAQVYSANAPESLRGPEHHAAWCDELAKWRYPATYRCLTSRHACVIDLVIMSDVLCAHQGKRAQDGAFVLGHRPRPESLRRRTIPPSSATKNSRGESA